MVSISQVDKQMPCQRVNAGRAQPKAIDLKLRIARYTQNLSLGRERSSELSLLFWKLPEIRLVS
jgi:hypothetical protein